MAKGGEAPQAPDPKLTIGLQSDANMKAYKQMLGDARATSITPYGTSSWANNRTFDQSGYDAAVAKAGAGTGSQPAPLRYNVDTGYYEPGDASAASTPGAAPNKDDFYTDNWTNTQALSPQQQQLYDATTNSQIKQAGALDGLTDAATSAVKQPIDLEAAGASRDKVEQALYDRAMRLAGPEYQRQEQAQNDRLQQSGFSIGNTGYGSEMDRLYRNQDESRGDARDRAIVAGGSEQSRMVNQLLQLRQAPLNELNAFKSGTAVQPIGATTQFSTPGLSAPDVTGAYNTQYQGELGAYNADTASQNGLMGGLFSLLAAPMTGGTSLAGKALGGLGGLFGSK